MKKPYGSTKPTYRKLRGGPKPAITDDDRSKLLFSYAIKLFDKGDGRAVDWPMVAAMLFKAGCAAWDEAGRSERAMQVLRRLEAHVYDRMVGNSPEDGTPYTVGEPPRQPSGPSPEPAPGHDLHNG